MLDLSETRFTRKEPCGFSSFFIDIIIFSRFSHLFLVFRHLFFHRFPLISTGFPWRIPIEISSQPQPSPFRTRPDTEYWEMALNATKADFPFDTWRANLSGTVPKFFPFFFRNVWNFLVFKFSWLPLFFGHVHEISGF